MTFLEEEESHSNEPKENWKNYLTTTSTELLTYSFLKGQAGPSFTYFFKHSSSNKNNNNKKDENWIFYDTSFMTF